MIGRLRLWSGYVLFAYVTTHLLNHALGLISLRVIEGGRIWFVYLWQSLPGQVALYGALLIHFTLALWAIVRRRSFRLSPWEWTQLVLGASIVPLAALHVVATRVAHDYYGVESGYPWVLASLATSGWCRHRAAVRPAPRRLDPCLHRPPLRLAPEALVSRLAADALCHRPAGAGRRHRRRGVALRDFAELAHSSRTSCARSSRG